MHDLHEDDGDAAPGDANGNDAQRSEAQRKREPAATLSSLRKLNVNTIFDDSKRGVLHALHQRRDGSRAAEVLAELDQRVADGKPHAAKQRARFLECSREHASAWLTSSRRDRSCCMVNGLFRIAVAIRVGVNPFEGVPSTYLCAWCKEPVGDDLYSHCIECKSARKGDNNRRHQQLQQVLVNLARAVGEGRVMTVPQVLAFFGAGAHETGHPPPVRARARANHRETEEQNSRRQGDFGLVEVFRRGQLELVDLTVSDGGGAEPGVSYVAGKLCIQRAIQKRDTYAGDDGRFEGIADDQLTILSFDCMGGMSPTTKEWLQALIHALSDADPSVPQSVIASRVWCSISVSLQTSLAQNALQFFNAKLLPPARMVGAPNLSCELPSSNDGLEDLRRSQSAAAPCTRIAPHALPAASGIDDTGDAVGAARLPLPSSNAGQVEAATGGRGEAPSRRASRSSTLSAAGDPVNAGDAVGASCPPQHFSQAGNDGGAAAGRASAEEGYTLAGARTHPSMAAASSTGCASAARGQSLSRRLSWESAGLGRRGGTRAASALQASTGIGTGSARRAPAGAAGLLGGDEPPTILRLGDAGLKTKTTEAEDRPGY